MTKEPIMIDDVDVSECEHFDLCETMLEYSECLAHCSPYPEGACYDDCNEHPNCYYKKLKRKEQECEDLREELEWLHNLNDQRKAENKKLKELLNIRIEDLCDSCGASSMIPMPCKVYEQALQEIKDYCNKYAQNSIGFKKQILQKCEVINDKKNSD